MKKRLRKKYHLREFQEFCFDINFQYMGKTDSPEGDLFWEEFILQCIEGNGLNCGGGMSDEGWDFTAHSVDKNQAIEAQLEAVRKWLEARSDVQQVSCGNFRDLWYDFPIGMNEEMNKKPLQYFVQEVRRHAQSFFNDGDV